MADGETPLAGLRVVERTGGLSGSFAGFLLAALGADVVRVESPGSEPRGAGDRVLHRNKRSAVLDLARAADIACWESLLAGADAALVDETGPDLIAAGGLVACHVATWGRDGHPERLPAEEALVAALSGVQAMQWSWPQRPVWLVTPMISYMTGMLAGLAVLAATFGRRRGGPGQVVEVSGLGGAIALNSGTYVGGQEHRASLSRHGDPRGLYPTYALYPTADGWLFIGALTQAFWVKLMTCLERVDLLAHPQLQGNPFTFGVPEIRELVRAELDPIFASRPTAEWLAILREADIPCGPVQTRAEALDDPDARALGLVVPVDDPVLGASWQPAGPAAFSDTPEPTPRPAPLPGADTPAVRAEAPEWRRPPAAASSRAPATCLEGIRVLDLASFIAGPFCPLLLADLGADVVKIESPEGDPFRMAAFGFVGWNRGKRSLVLDLKRPEGRAVFLDLARRADVVVDNFRAGVMERLGIGWEELRGLNPRLVHTSITGYGCSGPLAALPGFDPVFQARTGLMQAQGGADDPVLHMVAYTDYCAGTLGALATVAALFARERTGRGQRVDVSLFRTGFVSQAADMVLAPGQSAAALGGRDYLGPSASRRLYACQDGWVCIVAGTAAEATALGGLAGVPVGLDDPAEGNAAAAIARLIGDEPRATALARLAAAGVPAAPCLGFEELFTHPYLRATGAIVEQQHPTLGALLLGGPFIRFAATPIVYRRSAPLLGADGPQVLGEIGYGPERIAALVAAGVVGGGAPGDG